MALSLAGSALIRQPQSAQRLVCEGLGPPAHRALIAARVILAGLAGYGSVQDRLPGGLAMLGLLLIDVALCAVLIMVAATVMLRRWRRSNGQPLVPVSQWRGAVAARAGGRMAQRERAVVPGFSEDSVEPGLGAPVPAEPQQAAQSQLSEVSGPEPGPDGSGAEPDGQQAAAGAVTMSDRIGRYYEEADRPMANYLAALGWTGEPETHDPG